MADTEHENSLGVTDRRRVQNQTDLPGNLGETRYGDVGSLRARLSALNGTFYTALRLNAMTKHDMVYALRTIDDAAGI